MIRNNSLPNIELDLKDGVVMIGSDVHFPYQDDKAIDAFIAYAQGAEPDILILDGDLIDFYKLSRFAKDPSKRNPEEEIIMCREFLERLRKELPETPIYYCIGNHETRLERYVFDNAPMLIGLMKNVFEILHLNELNITGCGRIIINDTFTIKHGNLLGSKAGLSAIKELESHYTSGASGHTHRLARYSTRKSGRRFIWLETGCLCDLEPEYMTNADWEQGFGLVVFKNKRLKYANVVPIVNGEIIG